MTEKMLDLQFSSQARDFLKKLDKSNWIRVVGKIEEIKKNPFPHKVKRVEDRKEKIFRIRIGDYRVLYIVFDEQCLLFVSKIEKRSRAYD